jgi:hypothetical protein
VPEVNVHPALRLELPGGGEAVIDTDMVPLIRALWALGLQTTGCCQDLGESVATHPNWAEGIELNRHATYWMGQAWLKMPLNDALTFLDKVNADEGFHERLRRWRHPDSWETYAYLLPGDGGARLSTWAQIHFPKQQLAAVVTALQR